MWGTRVPDALFTHGTGIWHSCDVITTNQDVDRCIPNHTVLAVGYRERFNTLRYGWLTEMWGGLQHRDLISSLETFTNHHCRCSGGEQLSREDPLPCRWWICYGETLVLSTRKQYMDSALYALGGYGPNELRCSSYRSMMVLKPGYRWTEEATYASMLPAESQVVIMDMCRLADHYRNQLLTSLIHRRGYRVVDVKIIK